MPPAAHPTLQRLGSIDAYRGLVMFLMMAEVLHLARVAKALPDSSFWSFLAYHQTHVEWSGCSLHDLIQPSFSFLVGVALPFSLAQRRERSQSLWLMALHALWRSCLLVILGIFLRSVGKSGTYFTFEDTLSQIGLGYFALFLLGLLPASRWRTLILWGAAGVILIGCWGLFAAYPLPGSDFDFAAVGVPPGWSHNFTGFAAHWNKNSNPAWAFDTWFLNLFPRGKPFTHNGGGYATLSFIPTLGTMILGLIAGHWLRDEGSAWRKVGWLVLAGAGCLTVGWSAEAAGACPIVKRIWTPTWVLYSGGWCFLILAAFYVVMDAIGWQGWAYPLRVIGANSIAAYCMAHLIDGFIVQSIQTHIGLEIFGWFGAAYEPLLRGLAVLLVYWLILWWMYRRRIFLRI